MKTPVWIPSACTCFVESSFTMRKLKSLSVVSRWIITRNRNTGNHFQETKRERDYSDLQSVVILTGVEREQVAPDVLAADFGLVECHWRLPPHPAQDIGHWRLPTTHTHYPRTRKPDPNSRKATIRQAADGQQVPTRPAPPSCGPSPPAVAGSYQLAPHSVVAMGMTAAASQGSGCNLR